MHGTAARHPLAREYLRNLDAALRVLPPGRARELREQVTAHLDEALPPGASDEAVADALRQLGPPRDLAAEAIAVSGKRPWPTRVRWPAWAAIATAALIGVTVAYTVVVATTGPLTAGASTWWSPQDAAHAADSSAGAQPQTTTPIRPGHRQGFVIVLSNPTGMTQTVLRGAGDFGAPNVVVHGQVTASTYDLTHTSGGLRSLAYHPLPLSVPPHQSRAFRVMWTSHLCLHNGMAWVMPELNLRVRVGWTARTEDIPLPEGYGLTTARRGCPGTPPTTGEINASQWPGDARHRPPVTAAACAG
jgi:HAAS